MGQQPYHTNRRERLSLHNSTDELKSYIEARLLEFESSVAAPDDAVEQTTTQMLRPSPQFANINEIYQDETSNKSITPKKLNFNISNDVINEEPEDLEDEADRRKLSTIAQQLFELKYNEIPMDKYTALLGTNQKWNYELCIEFMKLFGDWPMELVAALRLLCSRLYLVAESTQIDQLLEVFSKSWCSAHPQNEVGDFKDVHIVCFSLFILNSDLHNGQNQETKFTREEFVANTIYAINRDKSSADDEQAIIDILRCYYDAISNNKLEIMANIPNFKLRHKQSSTLLTPPKQHHHSNVSLVQNKNQYRLSSIGSTISASASSRRVSSFTDASNYDVSYERDHHDDQLEAFGPPWAIEGLIKCQGKAGPKQKKKGSLLRWITGSTSVISSDLDIYNVKDWKQNIVVISKGLLKQYSFGSASDRKNFIRTKLDEFVNTVITYNLYSATASLVGDNVISNSNVKTNGVAWVLTIPNLLTNDYSQDKRVVYYAPNMKVASSFVETCNFWAARITSIPNAEQDIVTNQEYGWSSDLLQGKVMASDTKLQQWQCLLSIESSFIPSSHSLESQFDNMKHYIDKVDSSIREHNALKPKLEKIWNKDTVDRLQLVLNNWSEKYVHLFKQRSKYKVYLDSLALALSFRASKV